MYRYTLSALRSVRLGVTYCCAGSACVHCFTERLRNLSVKFSVYFGFLFFA